MLVHCIENESQEDHGQAEGGGVMTTSIIDSSVITAHVLMSVDTKKIILY